MKTNETRTKAAFIGLVAVAVITAAVGGCSAAGSETEMPAREQVEVLELKVENTQYQALDLGQARPGWAWATWTSTPATR